MTCADQAFQLEADALRVLRDDRQVERLAEVSSSHRAAGIGEDGEDLPVGGVLGDLGRHGYLGGGRLGEGGEGLRAVRKFSISVSSPWSRVISSSIRARVSPALAVSSRSCASIGGTIGR
ncbi:hypothetical protein Slala05_64160 [Streptomyces lavendulae subsp. lavendulae]|nr:hypothetical protein Slala05_64160 [Streptomyces lavendulae subsp. lavendulae]